MSDNFYEQRKAERVPFILEEIQHDISTLRMHINWLFYWYGGTAGNVPTLIAPEVWPAYSEAMKKLDDLEKFLYKPDSELK